MQNITVRFVHKIAPSAADTKQVNLPDNCWSDSKKLGAALRKVGVLQTGQRIKNFRVEANKVVVFPTYCIWHSIILTFDLAEYDGVSPSFK